jgi:hypothetical protein
VRAALAVRHFEQTLPLTNSARAAVNSDSCCCPCSCCCACGTTHTRGRTRAPPPHTHTHATQRSGKTHTMSGTPGDPGIIPRAITALFQHLQQRSGRDGWVRRAGLAVRWPPQPRGAQAAMRVPGRQPAHSRAPHNCCPVHAHTALRAAAALLTACGCLSWRCTVRPSTTCWRLAGQTWTCRCMCACVCVCLFGACVVCARQHEGVLQWRADARARAAQAR